MLLVRIVTRHRIRSEKQARIPFIRKGRIAATSRSEATSGVVPVAKMKDIEK
jgi:hypothetical protein